MALNSDLKPVYMNAAAAKLLVQTIEQIGRLNAGAGIEITQSPAGITISGQAAQRGGQSGQTIPAKITATGTGQQAGLQSIELLRYNDKGVAESNDPAQIIEFAARDKNGVPAPIHAIVDVEFVGSIEGTTNPLYLFDRSPGRMMVKLTGDGAGDGFYQGVEVTGNADTFTDAAGGVTFDGTDYPEIYETAGTAGLYDSDSEADVVAEVTITRNDDDTLNAYFTAGGSLPPPGLEFQSLQLDQYLAKVWGWVRIAPAEEE